ncbi:hypothetical protein ACQP2X_32215 [Actinoplanes sp. CA-131856]
MHHFVARHSLRHNPIARDVVNRHPAEHVFAQHHPSACDALGRAAFSHNLREGAIIDGLSAHNPS